MSAAVDATPRRSLMDTSTDSDGFGVVVPLHPQRTRPVPPTDGHELWPISPELALVDPELARRARALLPDPTALRPAARPLGELLAAPLEVVPPPLREPERAPERTPRRRTLVLGGLALAGWAVAALMLVPPRLSDEPARRAAAEPAGATQAPTDVPAARQPATREPAPAAPTASSGDVAAAPAHDAQTFVWVAVPDAVSYEFQLFRGDRRVFRARVQEPRLALPARWRVGERTYQLTPGSYRWYVWPVSKRTKRQAAVAVVQARLVIEDAPK